MKNGDDWSSRLRSMLLSERQVLACLERHRAAASEDIKVRYAYPVSLGQRRLRLLEAALERRGGGPGPFESLLTRAAGRWIGALTSFGGRRRIIAADVEGLTRLGDLYAEAYSAGPPADVETMIAAFLGEIQAERCALLEEMR